MSKRDRRDEPASAASAAEESSAALLVLGAYRENVVELSGVLEKLAQRSVGTVSDAPTDAVPVESGPPEEAATDEGATR